MSDPLAIISSKPAEPDLFSLPVPEPLTTQQEGMVAADLTRSKRYEQILELLRSRGPLAAWQIADALNIQPHQVSGRLTELAEMKTIEDTGERRKNPRTGVSGRVMRLAN